jgi:MFS family permease
VNNLNDGLAWGIFPLFYAAVWGLGQLVTGALSDRTGRKWLIAGGM